MFPVWRLACLWLLLVLALDYASGQRSRGTPGAGNGADTRLQPAGGRHKPAAGKPARRLPANPNMPKRPPRGPQKRPPIGKPKRNVTLSAPNKPTQKGAWSAHLEGFECGLRFEPPPGLREGSSRRRRWVAGGYDAKLYSYPSYLKLTISHADGTTARCGATLISRRHVISATHCFMGDTPLEQVLIESTIYQRSRPGTVVLPMEKVCHLRVEKSDVTVLKLATPANFTPSLQPACLPNKVAPTRDMEAIAVGLGGILVHEDPTNSRPEYDLAEELQAIPVKRIACVPSDWSRWRTCFQPYLDEYMGDTCSGDSGGPVYMAPGGRQTVYGVTSEGPEETCKPGQIGYSVNADLYSLRHELIKLLDEC